jgi:O-antigen ligase
MNSSNNIYASGNSDYIGVKESRGLIHVLALMATSVFILLIPWADGVHDGLPRILGITVFGLSGLLIATKGTHKNYSFYHFFVVLLWLWVIISLAWTPDEVLGTELAVTMFQLMLLPLVFTLIITKKSDLLLAYQSYVFGCYIAFGIIFYNYTHNIFEIYGRYTIANIATDGMAYILALGVPMAAYLAKSYDNKLLKIINILAMPVIIYAIFLTATRTGSLVAMIGVAYWLFTHRKASIVVKISMLVVLSLSVVAVLNFAPKASVDRIFSSGKSIKSGTLNYRTVIWKASIDQWKHAPIVGSGVASLYTLISKKHVEYEWAHNTYIQFLVENGIIGLMLYLLVIISLLYFVLQTPFDEKVFLLSLLLSVLVSQVSLHTHLQKETWFVLSMIFIHAFASSRDRVN